MVSKGLIGNWQPLNTTAVTDMTVTDMTVTDMTVTDMTVTDITVTDVTVTDVTVTDIITINIVLNPVTDMMPPNEKKKIIFCSTNCLKIQNKLNSDTIHLHTQVI